METNKKIIYDGKNFCSACACPVVELYDGEQYSVFGACPKVEYDTEKKMVRIYDPQKPERGSFTTTVKEYNLLLKHAKPVK